MTELARIAVLWVHFYLVYLSANIERRAASRGNEVTLQQEGHFSVVYYCVAGDVSGLFKGTNMTTVQKT
jgi:hypothetical protein